MNRVAVGNRLMSFSAGVFNLCLSLMIGIAMGNPHSSRIWQAPAMFALSRRQQVFFDYTDFCIDRMSWRKRTRIMYAFVDLSCVFKHCCSLKGICDRSGSNHVVLSGSLHGVFLTLIAEPYPVALCNRIARAFHNYVCNRHVRSLANLCMPEGM